MKLRLRFRCHFLNLVLVAAAFSAAPLAATTYLFMSDQTLLQQATMVAEVKIEQAKPTSASPAGPAIVYRGTIQQVLKGEPTASQVVFALPGGPTADGRELHVPGVPRFREGEEALLFLTEAGDGSFALLHWSLGAFHKFEIEGRSFALRNLRDEDFLGRGTSTPNKVRDYAAFANWLGDHAAGIERAPDYFASDSGSALRSFYNLFKTSGRNSRWPDFDTGGEVIYKSGPGNNFGSTGLIQPALDAWNNEVNTPLRLTRSGATSATGGLMRSDGVNTFAYGDPNNLLPGKFDCSQGGFVAAGFYWTAGTTSALGRSFNKIVEGDVVINDGMECLKGLSQLIAEIFTHEVGHTLGIAHSCGSPDVGACTNPAENDATMRASAHADGRSAVLKTDDRSAARALYGGSGGGGTTPPPPAGATLKAPSDLTVDSIGNQKVTLSWVDNSTGETENEVWAKKGKKKWALWTTVGADATSAAAKQLEPGAQYKFRVRSKAGDSVSKYSSNVKIKTTGGGGVPAAPSELAVVATSSTTATLSWKDNSNNEKKFVVQVQGGDGLWVFLKNASSNSTSSTFEGATPGATYGFRVRARRGDDLSGFSNEVTITMPQ